MNQDCPSGSYLSEVALAEDGEEAQVLSVVLPRAVAQHVRQLGLVDLKERGSIDNESSSYPR